MHPGTVHSLTCRLQLDCKSPLRNAGKQGRHATSTVFLHEFLCLMEGQTCRLYTVLVQVEDAVLAPAGGAVRVRADAPTGPLGLASGQPQRTPQHISWRTGRCRAVLPAARRLDQSGSDSPAAADLHGRQHRRDRQPVGCRGGFGLVSLPPPSILSNAQACHVHWCFFHGFRSHSVETARTLKLTHAPLVSWVHLKV